MCCFCCFLVFRFRALFGPVLGLPGGSRCLNRVPRFSLVIFVWLTAESKPLGTISDHFGTKCSYIFVLFVLPLCYIMFGFRPLKAIYSSFFIEEWSPLVVRIVPFRKEGAYD